MTIATVSHTNTKLGPLIHGWSIPAGRDWSCPGESCLCRTRCYARHGFFRMKNVKKSHKNNFAFSKQPEFPEWMQAQLTAKFVRIMRIHVSGDFYNNRYIRAWDEVVRRSQRRKFFAYTRSWRIDEMLPELIKLASYPNFQMWWSIDRETGPAPLIRGIRRAYMAIDDIDAANAPDDCDLVFRVQTDTMMKKANGIQVCPPENGVTLKSKITCSSCGICWNQKETKWEDELLPYFDQEPVELLAPLVA